MFTKKKQKKRRGRYIKKPAPAPGRGVSSPRLHSMYVSVWVSGGPFEVAKPCRCVLKVSTSLTPLLQALKNGILNMHTFKGDWATEPGGLTRTNRCLTTNPLQRKTGERTHNKVTPLFICRGKSAENNKHRARARASKMCHSNACVMTQLRNATPC